MTIVDNKMSENVNVVIRKITGLFSKENKASIAVVAFGR